MSGKGGQGRCGDVRGEGCEGGEEVEGRESVEEGDMRVGRHGVGSARRERGGKHKNNSSSQCTKLSLYVIVTTQAVSSLQVCLRPSIPPIPI